MLLNFKKVGDILSLDDFNAVIYLLTRNHCIEEEIILTNESYKGGLGEYLLNYDEEISLKGELYLISDNNSNLILTIDSDFVGRYSITLDVYSELYDEEQVDENDSKPPLKVRSVEYVGVNLESRHQIIIPLSDFSIGEYIGSNVKIKVCYTQPIIDKTSGSIQTDTAQNITKTADELINRVNTAPENQTTTIYLKPGETYELYNPEDNQDVLNSNIIIDNKSIIIKSGSTPSILDAGEFHRHFYITETGSLTLENITLTKGYSINDQLDNGKGGSIFIKSERDSTNTKIQGKLICNYCKFTNNRANLHGGALYNEDGIIDIKNTYFYNNEAKSSNNILGDGGALYNEGAS